MSSRRWFVHIDEPYYPSGHVVEAATPADAITVAWQKVQGDRSKGEDRIAFAVAPLDEVTFAGQDAQITLLVDDLDEDEARYSEEPRTLVRAIPTPSGILPTPQEIADDRADRRFFSMATYAIVSGPQHPTGWNPDPLGEHDRGDAA